tara:strand:- start:1024 stop:1224 length:201 start_codon:yes stop_codon:yes gene_type:complete
MPKGNISPVERQVKVIKTEISEISENIKSIYKLLKRDSKYSMSVEENDSTSLTYIKKLADSIEEEG